MTKNTVPHWISGTRDHGTTDRTKSEGNRLIM